MVGDVHGHERGGITDGRWAEDEGADDGEDGGVGGDAKGDGDDGGCGEAGGFDQASQGVGGVLQDRHGVSPCVDQYVAATGMVRDWLGAIV